MLQTLRETLWDHLASSETVYSCGGGGGGGEDSGEAGGGGGDAEAACRFLRTSKTTTIKITATTANTTIA
jgi:hypothetical protein